MRTHPLQPTRVLVLACALALLLFLLDIAMPQAQLWGLYFLPIVLVFLWGRRRDIYLAAVLGGALVLAAYAFDGSRAPGDPLFSQLLLIAILWGGAWLLAQRRELQEQLLGREQALEEQVKARTAELAASEQRYRLLADNSSDLVWAVDMNGAPTYISPAVERLRCVTPEVEQSLSWFDRMPPETAAWAEAAIQAHLAALRAGLPIDATPQVAPAYRHDGTLMWGETVVSPLYDEDGRPLGICGTTRDVTARRAAERELARMAAIIQSSNDAIISADFDGTLRSMNPAAEQLFGRSAAATVGQHISLLHPELQETERGTIFARLRAGETVTLPDFIWTAPEGRGVDLAVTALPIFDNAGQALGVASIARDITARKAAERERLFLSALVASSPEAVIGRTVDGTILSWNRGAEQIFGYTAEEAIGQNLTMLAAPHTRAQMAAVMAEVAQGHTVEGVETQRMAKDGRVFDCRLSSFPVRDAAGAIIGVASFTHDISRRKAAEQALRASEERFTRLFSSSPVGICLTRVADGGYLEVNDAFLALIGYRREELIGRTSRELGVISPADRARLAAALQEQGSLRGVDLVIHNKAGEKLYTIFAIDRVDFAGEPCVLSSAIDITERKRLEEQLHNSEQKYRLLADNSPDIILATDSAGMITFVSPAVEHLTGFTPEEVPGLPFEAMRAPATAGMLRREMAVQIPLFQARQALPHPHFEFEAIRKDGSPLWLESVASPQYNAGGSLVGFVVVLRDVTVRKRLEAALRQSEQKWRSVFEFLPVGLSVVDGKYQVTDANPALAQILAMPLEDIQQGKYAQRRYCRPDLSPMSPEEFPSFRAVSEGQIVRDVVVGVEKEDGELIWVSVSATPESIDGYALTVTVDITAQKRAEQALRQSEMRYRLLVDNAQDVIWTVDLAGRFTFLNPSVERQLGYCPEELIGQRFDRWLTPASAAAAMTMLAATAAQLTGGQRPEAAQFEGEQIRKDGTQIFTHTVGVPLLDEAGRPAGFQGITRDVTEHHRLAAAVQESERRYRMLADNMSDFITTRNLRGEFTYFSPSCDRLGLRDKIEAIRAKRPVAGFDAQQQAAANARLDRYHAAMAAGQPLPTEHYELEFADTAGTTHWVEWVTTPMHDEVGELTGFISIGREITKRKQMEAELRVSLTKYSVLFDTAPIGISLTDDAGQLIEGNREAEQILGISHADQLRRTYDGPEWAIVRPDGTPMPAAEYASVRALNEQRRVDSVEMGIVRNDGETRWISVNAAPIPLPGFGVAITYADITARRRLEEQLRDSEERFRLIVENSPDVIALYNEQRTLTYISPNLEVTHGYTAEHALAVDPLLVEAIITPPGEGPRAEELARLRAHPQFADRCQTVEVVTFCLEHPGVQQRVEMSNTLPSGEVRDFEATYRAHLRADGSRQVVSITRNITERKRAEAERRILTERLSMAAQMGSIGMWDWRAGSDEVIWDERMCLLHGLTPGTKMTFAAWRALIHPDDRAAAEASSRMSGREHTRTPVEFRVVLPDGSVRNLLSIGGGLYDEAGTPVRQLGVTMDITERKRAEIALAASEARLREANQRLQLAADAAGIGIWNWNFAGSNLEWDDRMYELYAVPAEQHRAGITYDRWRACIHPDDLALADPAQGDPGRIRSQSSAVYRIVLPGGAVRYIESHAVADYDNSGRPWRVIGINRDITDQKLYEQLLHDTNLVLERRVAERTDELRSALTNLQRANQLKDEFMAMISHELRTPLTGVLSMSEMLEDEIAGPLNARQATYVKAIGASGERLLAVINGILGYTHLLSGEVELHAEPCDLAYLLGICAASQGPKAAEKNQSVAVHVAPPDLTITTDAAALAEVLKRLLDNALKFTPEGGQIGLEAHPSAAPGTSDLPVGVDLVVWDTGIGIPRDQLEHIFHAFVQADGSLHRSHEGIGLGLAYVDLMVHLLGGTIGVASEPGRGSRFTITLAR